MGEVTGHEGRRPGGVVPRWRHRLPALAEVAGATLLTGYAAWPFLRPDRYVVGFDTLAYSGPNLQVTLDAWRAGRLPLWNDQIFAGAAHLGNPQAGALYPFKALALPLDLNRGMGLLVALHLFLLAAGLLVLVRGRLRLRPPAGLVAVAAVIGSGAVMVKSTQFEQILVVAWLPWLLVVVDGLVRSPRPQQWLAPAGVVTALTLLAGHPQIVYLLVPLVAAWALGRLADEGAWPRLGWLAAAAAFGAALAAPQLLTAAQATAEAALGQREAQLRLPAYVLDPARLPQGVLGDPYVVSPGFATGASEAAGGAGAAAFVLALATLVVAWRRWTVRLLGAAAGVAAVLAVGPRWFPYRLALDVVPGFSFARVPGRWILVTVLALGILASVGADALARTGADGHVLRRWVIPAVAVAAVVNTGPFQEAPTATRVTWYLLGATVIGIVALRPTGARAAVAFALVPVLAVTVEQGLALRASDARKLLQPVSMTGYVNPATEFLRGRPERVLALTFDRLDQPRYAVSTLRPNANVLFGIRSLDGYDGGVQVTTRWVETMEALSAGPFNRDLTLRSQIRLPLDAGVLARFGVRWVMLDTEVVPADQQLPGWPWPVAAEGSVGVWENPAWVGDTILWKAAVPTASRPAIAELLRSGGAPPAAALVPADGPRLSCTTACAPEGVPVRRPRPGAIDVTVTGSAPGILSVSEQLADGWRVTVDGVRAPLVEVDGMLLGVEVPAGTHEVRFRYQPDGLRAALAVSGLAAVGVVVIVTVEGGRRVRSRRSQDLVDNGEEAPLELGP